MWHCWSDLGEAAGASVAAVAHQNAPDPRSQAYVEARAAGKEMVVGLIRDVYGNPFRPIAFDPSWRTDAALSLAREMYESRDFAAMPILADALEEAGCDSPDVLAHCQGPGPHVRGCWVVDLVLGKG